MTQVAIQSTPTSGSWSSSASPTINTPAGADGQWQILIATWSSGSTVTAPSFSGWTLSAQEFIATRQNRVAIYTRTISGTTAAGTVSPTFGAAVSGQYWAGSFNGIPVSIALVADTGWSSSRVVPTANATENDSLHLVLMATASYPRSVAAVTNYTEVHDAYSFHSAGAYGLWIGVNRRNVALGSVASSSWPMYDYTATTLTGDQTIYASIILGPITPAESSGMIYTWAARSPTPAVTNLIRRPRRARIV